LKQLVSVASLPSDAKIAPEWDPLCNSSVRRRATYSPSELRRDNLMAIAISF